MPSVNAQYTFNAPSAAVWKLIADFGGVHKLLDPERVKSTVSDGNGVGAIRRIILADDSVIIERIEWKDETSRHLVYSIVGESVLPVREYLAVAKVTSIDSQTCQLDWQSTFAATGTTQHAEETVAALYNGGAVKIRELLE